MTLNDVILKVS